MFCKINEMPIVSIDCEMVGGKNPITRFSGYSVELNMLARVTIINYFGRLLLDKIVAPQQPITNYRTKITGLFPRHFIGASSFEEVTNTVCTILAGKIIVGHGLQNDFDALKLFYPKKYLRDTANYSLFRYYNNGRAPSLKELAKKHLHQNIQTNIHDSIEDAFAALDIYKLYQRQWETEIAMWNN